MIQIKDKILSFDVLERKFACNLSVCKGICCIDGDAGAPLESLELEQIKQEFEFVKPFLKPESLKLIEEVGLFVEDIDCDKVTPCLEDGSCAYLIDEGDVHICAFEKAYFEEKIKFRKPISCHLYPIRLTNYDEFIAVNYEKRDICKSAVINGEKNDIKVYEFLKDAIIRKFGEEFYEELDYAAKNYKRD